MQQLVSDLAVCRAATGVPTQNLRPTGAPHLGAAAGPGPARPGRPRSAVCEWMPLANRLGSMSARTRAGQNWPAIWTCCVRSAWTRRKCSPRSRRKAAAGRAGPSCPVVAHVEPPVTGCDHRHWQIRCERHHPGARHRPRHDKTWQPQSTSGSPLPKTGPPLSGPPRRSFSRMRSSHRTPPSGGHGSTRNPRHRHRPGIPAASRIPDHQRNRTRRRCRSAQTFVKPNHPSPE